MQPCWKSHSKKPAFAGFGAGNQPALGLVRVHTDLRTSA
jgi:hypothetical protein